MDNSLLWQSILSSFEGKISKLNLAAWFSKIKLKKREQNTVTISVPSIFVKEWLQNKFQRDILLSLQKFIPEIKEIKYIISPNEKQENNGKQQNTQSKIDFSQSKIDFSCNRLSGLNSKYTFKNFIVGGFNQLPAACAFSIINNFKLQNKPNNIYNPLFIYSNVGLGKTHLLEAVGNEVLNLKRKKKVKYIPCPNFTSHVISAVRNQTTEKVVDEYKSFDVLIIDDIEFIAGKEWTQEIFFRIFNDLVNNGSQILLSSDRPPRALEKIEERLKSRFEGGMVADISPPNFEERMAILEEKAKEREIILPKEILEFIAQNISKNIRELEGVLIKSFFLFQKDQNTKSVIFKIKEVFDAPKKRISPERVSNVVCGFYNISHKEVVSRSRKKEFVLPRQVIMYLLHNELSLSLPSIGVKIGNKDHTTVGYGCEKIEEKIKKDGDFLKDIEVIKERLYNI